MNIVDLPKIWTPSEVAEYLKVNEATVLQELEEGRLQGFKVSSEWRCTDADLLAYVDRGKLKVAMHEGQLPTQLEAEVVTGFTEVGPFDYGWPKYGGGRSFEHFEKGYETTRRINGHTFTFKIGFGEREAAGRLRSRIIVWLGNRPLVEFAGGNNYEADGLVASVIKLQNGRQLWPTEEIPAEYRSFKIARYDSLVQGPYASTNMAIVVHKDDLESMLRHAIIRAKWKELI